jgi:hypothetical protein
MPKASRKMTVLNTTPRKRGAEIASAAFRVRVNKQAAPVSLTTNG